MIRTSPTGPQLTRSVIQYSRIQLWCWVYTYRFRRQTTASAIIVAINTAHASIPGTIGPAMSLSTTFHRPPTQQNTSRIKHTQNAITPTLAALYLTAPQK